MTDIVTEMLTYHIVPENLSEHVFNVNISIPASKHDVVHLRLPAWIPGSYMIRDFCKNIHQLSARTPAQEKQSIEQIDKQTWRINNTRNGSQVSYQVYAFDLSVRGAYLFDEYAFFNGTSTFLEVIEFSTGTSKRISLSITNNQLQHSWQLCSSLHEVAVEKTANSHTHYFECEDYQTLIDHPVLMGVVEKYTFEVEGTRFHIVFSGNTNIDLERIADDLAPLCQHHIDLFGEFEESDYWFLTLLTEDGFGGLEHRASTALMFPRFHLPLRNESATRSTNYQRFLSLCSHELFHAWNVKRIKPEIMISPDLSSEQYMQQLWIYEGFTSLYDDLSLARTKLISAERYAEILGENLTRLNQTQGRHKQTITQSSFEAWSKFYKQDAGSQNHIVSYYNKGAIVALALDITLRQLSNNRYSINQLMQQLWLNYGSQNVGTPDNVIHTICKQHFNIDISSFLHVALYTTMDLPIDSLVQSIGLKMHLRPTVSAADKGGKSSSEMIKHAFGGVYKDQGSGVVLLSVQAGSPIARAGAQIGDVLIALGPWQINSANLQRLLDNQTGKSVNITLLRQGRLLQHKLVITPAINDTIYLSIEDATLFGAWIAGDVTGQAG